jgi:hypothetical protein
MGSRYHFALGVRDLFWGTRWQQVLLSADDEEEEEDDDDVVVDNDEFYLEEN